ncbi:anthranilate phosphoribosyltransferase [Lacticaseibacillus manihotivorans]|uniref:Anthranilate phosphoribosyltransferase n=2 Tax=Lacticaseibacillus manihotivorans TaxID=88233 RepID=A0A0R1QAJ0_9LACO|nr:anthranilate phosphoribosyltransferase [Lacticaseibacillus manihotivorans]KRL41597.1 anthranilate phosphoribosyltransferase [Lacticaseibacillus manihotivorans DSM 13343 = JCM 12514]QFQ91564.1 anthranilate phosphoribosyltransferase [Lacticaseibacillus manihotivorans]
MLNETIAHLVNHTDLTFDETKAAHNELLHGEVDPSLIASYLTAMAEKGATATEIAGAADSMRSNATKFDPEEPVLEVVGTGGDHANTFNISTTSMFVIAAAGADIAKHGNRAASSKSGAADVLEALGYNINASVEASEALLHQYHACFLFAQKYHAAMRFVGPTRKLLGFPTIFNLIGPLANPAKPTYQLLGVYREDLMKPMADALIQLGVKRGMVVHGEDGLDEVTATGKTDALVIDNGQITARTIDPHDYGFDYAAKADLVGGTPAENAQITRNILAGNPGPKTDAVLLNAGVALYIVGKADSITKGIALAKQTITDGKATALLDDLIKASNQEVSA